MKTITIILAGCLLMVSTGCESTATQSPLAEKINALRREKTQLARQIEHSGTEAEQLKKQIQVLSGLPDNKLENLYQLQNVKVTRYTNLYDKDKDGKKEKLIVYLQTIDEDGDIIKATGTVDVQLWDLNKKDGRYLLGQWRVKPDELKKLWYSFLLTTYYRLTFDVGDKIEQLKEPLTVKITFTDYLAGKVFKQQRTIKP